MGPLQLFDLRTKCSDLAHRIQQDVAQIKGKSPDTRGDAESFTNRYDPSSNRCFVEEFDSHSQTAINGEAQLLTYRKVIDGQEGTTLITCNLYMHGASFEKSQASCSGGDNDLPIPTPEAVAKMNSFMHESVTFPLPAPKP